MPLLEPCHVSAPKVRGTLPLYRGFIKVNIHHEARSSLAARHSVGVQQSCHEVQGRLASLLVGAGDVSTERAGEREPVTYSR